ncbi:MAG: DUF3575 domain-containing protein [Bacteroides sp.]|nr:DUF3575 domain-containing protein [Bacteroides sp.]
MERKVLIFILFIACCSLCYGQLNVESLDVYFRQGRSAWDVSYMDNGRHMQAFIDRIKQIQQGTSVYEVARVCYTASCSPEGSIPSNERLSHRRAGTLSRMLHRDLQFADSIVEIQTITEDWNSLAELVRADASTPEREHVLAMLEDMQQCIDNGQVEQCKRELMALDNGRPWRYMLRHFFPKLRRFTIHIYMVERGIVPQAITGEQPAKVVLPVVPTTAMPTPYIPPVVVPKQPVPVAEAPASTRGLYVKSNGIGWLMLIGNIALEYEFAERWSATLPVYYSGLNYFTSDVKFRTFCLQPEVRYWPENLQGAFVGAHLGVAWYNYAKGGDYRYQDHLRHTPALGGGLAAGYRHKLGNSGRWFMEYALGAGVYSLHYDMFRNEPDGKLVKSKKRTFFGIDQAAVSIAYRFDLKKGGRR